MPLKVGDKLPSVELYEETPSNKINIQELCDGKKVVLFAVPGAFTPGCSKVGDKIPNIDLYENTPGNKVNTGQLCEGKKVILFATPAPFSPGCSKTHLPGYVKEADNLKEHGIDEIVCVAVNDAFVLSAWSKETGAEGKIRLLSDPQATFTKAIELSTEIPVLGGTRSMRYSMLLDDGIIKAINVEPDGTGLSCSLAQHMKDKIKG